MSQLSSPANTRALISHPPDALMGSMRYLNEVSRFRLSWPALHFDVAPGPDHSTRCAITSFVGAVDGGKAANAVQVMRLVGPSTIIEQVIPLTFPQTAVVWCPLVGGGLEFSGRFLTIGDAVRIWRVAKGHVDRGGVIYPESPGEIMTCGDWGRCESIGAVAISASTLGIASVLDLEQEMIASRVVAHDHQIHALACRTDLPGFLTAGHEGSVRFFDMRDLLASYVYCSGPGPMLGVEPDPMNPYRFVAFSLGSQVAQVVDSRSPGTACKIIRCGQSRVTTACWGVEGRLLVGTAKGELMVGNVDEGWRCTDACSIWDAGAPIQKIRYGEGVISLIADGQLVRILE